jgi:hypothetical protein
MKHLLDKYKNNILSTRLLLAINGWHSDIRISRMGMMSSPDNMCSFQIWFSRWDWKGRASDRITFFSGAYLYSDNFSKSLLNAQKAVYDAAEACFRADKEFENSIPHMGNGREKNGKLKITINEIATKHIFASSQKINRFPTENLSQNLLTLEKDDNFFKTIFPFTNKSIDYEDRITTFDFNNPRNYENRNWGYKSRLIIKNINNIKVSYTPIESFLNTLEQTQINNHIEARYQDIKQLMFDYSEKGSLYNTTYNGLPPGFKTVAEKLEDSHLTPKF